jgi:hypothetical protein
VTRGPQLVQAFEFIGIRAADNLLQSARQLPVIDPAEFAPPVQFRFRYSQLLGQILYQPLVWSRDRLGPRAVFTVEKRIRREYG